ncbi:PTS sugar transporter subunit IIB [Anaerococcus lactolyticus]|uniref:PTS sugar transporter subunit IIB n=1 Tax=Anaerococcus lactolyticus TaxID=33032 RepID=UPI00288C30BC|nr:PTS sugar transporter subunit IIB [Anaerococcus lactolyticus]
MSKKIMLVCSAGMSTSMIVKKMQDVSKKENKNYEIFAVALSEYKNHLNDEGLAAILLGPQVSFMKEDIQNETNIPVDSIEMKIYGKFNGKLVLDIAEKMIKEGE